MRCDEFQEMLGRYLDEVLDEGLRLEFRRHLDECASCREGALAAEPSLLFALGRRQTEDPVQVEACVRAVAVQIRQARLARRLGGHRRALLAAAAALVVVIGGGVTWRMVGQGEGAPSAAVSAARTESEVAPVPPSVEVDMAGENVRVYQFATDENQDTAVYFVVNPAMEL